MPFASLCLRISAILVLARGAAPAPRRVRIDGQRFILSATNASIVLSGPNVVVKGPPYLPAVAGDNVCKDTVDDECAATGTCQTCTTFNQADVENIKARGWNSIRLGVVWAGAQPRDEDALDPDFLQRLHAVLDLTDRNGIHVVLDNHGDMVGSAGCGNGVPMWFQKKAAAELIGKPLVTPFPYSCVPSLDLAGLGDACGGNATRWAEYAGDPNYNLLNSCCQAMNSGNPAALGFTSISQKTMDFLITDGPGRRDFMRFWRLMAEAASRHPSAVAAELMNEPMSIKRKLMFETWKACAEEINSVVPDMSVSVADTGEGLLRAIVAGAVRLPNWISREVARELRDFDVGIVSWIKSARTVFYSWHWYDAPKSIENAIKEAQALGAEWNVPTFATEFMSCDLWRAAEAAGISHSYWHYSNYCNTGPKFGWPRVPEDSFGACILGGTPTPTPTPTLGERQSLAVLPAAAAPRGGRGGRGLRPLAGGGRGPWHRGARPEASPPDSSSWLSWEDAVLLSQTAREVKAAAAASAKARGLRPPPPFSLFPAREWGRSPFSLHVNGVAPP